MTDISDILPDFDLTPWRHLFFSLDKNEITVSELISSDAADIIRRCPLPIGDLRKLIDEIIKGLHADIKFQNVRSGMDMGGINPLTISQQDEAGVDIDRIGCVKTLDEGIDKCLGGGFYTKQITEIVGESAVGKTQFVQSLLLSSQLAPPRGLGRSVIYISTESPLNTRRLEEMLNSNPEYAKLSPEQKPSLDKVHAIEVHNMEAQEHVIQHRLPNAVKLYDAGLIVIDSVTANFRAEFQAGSVKGLADRAVELIRLGSILRRIAHDNDAAIVVTNQVSDRFEDIKATQERWWSSSPIPSSQSLGRKYLGSDSASQIRQNEIISLDSQQRFFTGWGEHSNATEQMKTPALGLTWANQLSARIVLKMVSERMNHVPDDYVGGNIWRNKKKKRSLAVVFAGWVGPTSPPLIYEIQAHGLSSQLKEEDVVLVGNQSLDGDFADMLDPKYWTDDSEDIQEIDAVTSDLRAGD